MYLLFYLDWLQGVGMLVADHLGTERKDTLSSDMGTSSSSTSDSSTKQITEVEDSNIVLDMTVSLCGMAARKVCAC